MQSQCGEDCHPLYSPVSTAYHAGYIPWSNGQHLKRSLGRLNGARCFLGVRRVYLQATGHHHQKQEYLGYGPKRCLLLSVPSLVVAPPSIYKSALNPPLPARTELDFVFV